MGSNVIGIDVEAAALVVQRWRRAVATWEAVATETLHEAGPLLLDGASAARSARAVAAELGQAADLLGARTSAMEHVRWAAGDGWSSSAGSRVGRRQEADELAEWLSGGTRGWMVRELADPSAAEWARMVETGTLVEGARTMRYFDIAREEGAGVIVVDFFIPDASSLVLAGDGRGHDDPIFGDLGAGDSRMIMVFDLESGRASVQFDDTCTVGGWACNEARPIEMGGSEVVWSPSRDLGEYGVAGLPLPVNLFEIPNQVSVSSVPHRLEVDYDVLNGIIPVGSVDGTFTLTSNGTGRYEVADIDSDEYPSIGIYQYRAGEQADVLARQDSRGVWAAFPVVPAIVDATGVAAEVASSTSAAVVDAGVEVASGAADVAVDLVGGGSLVDLIAARCAADPEIAACADIVADE